MFLETDSKHGQSVHRIGGSLVNIVLGALILWVGQTTFHHAGQLASVDERFTSVGKQFNAVDGRNERLRQRLEQVTSETNERTRSRFTREDGEKLATRVKEVADLQMMLERQLIDRVTSLQMKLVALETGGTNHQEVAILRAEMSRLSNLANYNQRGGYAIPAGAAAGIRPVQLPPVAPRR